MYQRNVHKLWKAKRLADRLPIGKKIISLINSVLLEENGPVAVLYPHTNMDTEIVALHSEGLSCDQIAQKLGLDGNGDTGEVMNAIECEGNYQ